MPFTLCHPAVILPAHRYLPRISSLSALVIGSMAPDFVYFLSLGISGTFTHTPAGVFLYCVPAGLLVYLCYYALIREAVLAWLPGAISSRMGAPIHWPVRSARSGAVVLGSLALGAASHVLWDSFTHANTIIVNNYPVFRTLVPLGEHTIPLFKLLQHLSSLIGFIIIMTFGLQWYRSSAPLNPVPRPISSRHRMITLAGISAASAGGGIAGLLLGYSKSIEHGLFNFVVSAMATAALVILILCCAWRVRARRMTS